MNGRKVNIDYIAGLNALQGIFILLIAYIKYSGLNELQGIFILLIAYIKYMGAEDSY